jgi:hypothetical protein
MTLWGLLHYDFNHSFDYFLELVSVDEACDVLGWDCFESELGPEDGTGNGSIGVSISTSTDNSQQTIQESFGVPVCP